MIKKWFAVFSLVFFCMSCETEETHSSYLSIDADYLVNGATGQYSVGRDALNNPNFVIFISDKQIDFGKGIVKKVVADGMCPNKDHDHDKEVFMMLAEREGNKYPVMKCGQCSAEYDIITGKPYNEDIKPEYKINIYNYSYDEETTTYTLYL